MMRVLLLSLIAIHYSLFTVSCYNRGPLTSDAWDLTSQQIDSISFYTTHHYTQNYNFIVTGDSLVVVAQQPNDMPVPEVMSLELCRWNSRLTRASARRILSPFTVMSESWWPISRRCLLIRLTPYG